jgi:hypothetical protein
VQPWKECSLQPLVVVVVVVVVVREMQQYQGGAFLFVPMGGSFVLPRRQVALVCLQARAVQ